MPLYCSYLTEWGRRERLDESTGRYCRPKRAPVVGEAGWTWAERPTWSDYGAKEARAHAVSARAAQARYASAYVAALAAGERAGVTKGEMALLVRYWYCFVREMRCDLAQGKERQPRAMRSA